MANEFFLDSLTTALAPDELIVSVRLPPWKSGRHWAFDEFARRRGDFALAGVALFFDLHQGHVVEPHIAAIGIGARPVRLAIVEQTLAGKAVEAITIREAVAAAIASIDPPGDIHAPGDYRRALFGVLLERALAQAAGLQVAELA
jgi:carbon-monoxide dehydrogenase medium subunit